MKKIKIDPVFESSCGGIYWSDTANCSSSHKMNFTVISIYPKPLA